MDASQGNELVLVAHGAEFALELGDGGVVQILLPVERWRAVVGQHFAGVFGVHSIGKLLGELEVWRAGFAPHQVGVFGIGNRAGNSLLNTFVGFVKAFGGALAGQKGLVVLVVVAGQQVRGFGVGACNHQGGHAAHVGGHARGDQLLAGFGGRHQHFAAHVAAFLDRGELVFPMHARSTCFDHGFHQLKGVQHAAETGFGVGHDGGEVVDIALVARVNAFGMLDFVGAAEGIVDAFHDGWHRVHRVQRLVGVHGGVGIVVGGDLPARQVNGFHTGLDLLHGLATSERAQAIDIGLGVHEVPELFGATAGERVLYGEGAAQAHHVGGAVATGDALPAWVGGPVFFKGGDLLLAA